ncbi:MAG: carboxylesterase family protein [Myxococcales bacterium]|nr:carboxylesterase family protein [Myxococcales bacterium]
MRIVVRLAVVCLFTFAAACDSSSSQPGDMGVGDGVGDATPADAGDPTLVTTQQGPIKCKVIGGFRACLGIPYAAPPVGDLRWKPPEPPKAWTTPRDATQHGPSCWQPYTEPVLGVSVAENFDEDCLSLAVWSPNPAPAKAPVMVWFHGGGFAIGGAATELFSGQRLAALHDVVVVAVNYRLGPLGMMAHPALGQGPGNFLLLDQQAALRWVQDNIRAFGGDPENVTIFGESAGAFSCCYHLVSPKSKDLFHRAVMQSGTCMKMRTRAQAESYGQLVSKAVGCDTASDEAKCLRDTSAKRLAEAMELPLRLHYDARPFMMPFVDGDTLLEQPPEALANGNFNKVPLIIGSNATEATLFLNTSELKAMDTATMRQLVENAFSSADADKILARYDTSSYGSPVEAMVALITDSIFTCAVRRMARAVAAAGQPVYLYQFTHEPSVFAAVDAFLRSPHGAELLYLFGMPIPAPLPASEKPVATAIQGYWTRFAKTSDPNGGGAAAWPRYDAASGKYLEIGVTQKEGSALQSATCDFWDTLPLELHAP